MSSSESVHPAAGIVIRPLQQSDLAAADGIFRAAFGTFLRMPNPADFAAGRDYFRTRWLADSAAALAAETGGALVGSNLATRWGSFAFFGPLTVRPACWNQGIAQDLLAATMDLFAGWGVSQSGLFTFAHSTAHVHLYQKFGYWPRFLTAVLSKSVDGPPGGAPRIQYSELLPDRQAEALETCRALTDSLYSGLDVTREIVAVQSQALGDTLLLWDGDALDAFAVCHCGEGTEAGPGNCYVKFAAVAPGPRAEANFARLLHAAEALTTARGLRRVEAGVNLGRSRAYRALLEHGYRADIQGLAMHRPDAPAYSRPEVFVLEDLR